MEKLFEQWAGEKCRNKIQITANGSNRLYFRLEGETCSCIATVNENRRENEAFFFFARQLRERGVRVPQIYAVSADRTLYLQEDLGNVSLYSWLSSRKSNGIDVTDSMLKWYKKAIDALIFMQEHCSDIDFNAAYPRPCFDRQAIQWDLNYFKYYFLQLFHIPFDEELLEKDYRVLTDYLLEDDCNCFMFRDFQSRNIMIKDDELYFIDFQGARKGAPQYDLASLLYSSKSDVPDDVRLQLLDYYMECKKQRDNNFDCNAFRMRFYAYTLTRMMQAMGAYGFRGVVEKKEHFVKSIPFAVNNLRKILSSVELPIDIPHLTSVWRHITSLEEYSKEDDKLTVSIFSFSYRKGIPFDKYGNGGGYVFDCRMLPNPGLYDEYKELNGRDPEVAAFFESYKEPERFLSQVQAIVGDTVETYQSRGYTRLMVCFGCTGGRHRSVYCAEQTAKFIRERYDCNIFLHHVEQGKMNLKPELCEKANQET